MLTDHFLARGATVVGFSRNEDRVESPRFHHVSVDVGEPDSVARAFMEVRRRFGSIEIAINNAAVLTSQYSMIMSADSARRMLDTNLLGPFLVSREAAKLMKRNRWGRIVNIGSMASVLEPSGDSVYAACKAGLITLANVMAREFADLGITCNTLGVTAIETDMLSQLPRDRIDEVVAGLPLAGYATAQDITNIVDFFVSPASSKVTAQTIFLGGVHA